MAQKMSIQSWGDTMTTAQASTTLKYIEDMEATGFEIETVDYSGSGMVPRPSKLQRP